MNSKLSDSLINPILSGAVDIYQSSAELDIDAEIAQLAAHGAVERSQNLAAYVGELDIAANERRLAEIFTRLATTALEQRQQPEAAFATFVSQLQPCRFGLVFTAHPTFATNQQVLRSIAELASGQNTAGQALGANDKQQRQDLLSKLDHRPDTALTLEHENYQAESAIKSARSALRRALRVLYQVSSQQFPQHWQQLEAHVADIATWVGGDMDGRNDISWAESLALRWQAAASQYGWLAQELRQLASWPKAAELALDIGALAHQLETSAQQRQQQADRLAQLSYNDAEQVSKLARDLSQSDSEEGDQHALMARLQQLRRRCSDQQLNIELALLQAELRATGAGSAYLHVRLNATQLHNALRHTLKLDGEPTHPAFKRSSMRKIAEALVEVKGIGINFGNLMREQSSARRMFMQVAQLSKHCDTSSPIRFLIAESDSPFTVLAALYLAKRYQVAERVDISPLFETAAALEQGAEIISTLLANPQYRAYVRQRGCLCVQTGFSDAGRHLGQVASALAIERFQLKIAQALVKARLSSVQLILFNTHGESLGRGGHPGSLRQRWAYLLPPAARAAFSAARINLKHETSFQGADGYIYFHTPAMAFACLTRAFEDNFAEPSAEPDPFYTDVDQSLEFFISLQEHNQRLMENPDFAVLLTNFGPNLLYPTGSRQMQRQHERVGTTSSSARIQIRAIIQNAVLQQLGWVATACFGVGAAMSRDPEWFRDNWSKSERLRSISQLAFHAYQSGDIDILSAYLELYNPSFWLRLAPALPESDQRAARHVARLLAANDFYHQASRVLHRLARDAMRIRQFLQQLPPSAGTCSDNQQRDRLQQIRLSLIIKLFLHATRLPAFSSNPQIRVEDVMRACLRLDTAAALTILRRAFPASDSGGEFDFGEAASEVAEDFDYRKEQQQLFSPIEQSGERIGKITAALCHYYRAFG